MMSDQLSLTEAMLVFFNVSALFCNIERGEQVNFITKNIFERFLKYAMTNLTTGKTGV